MKRILSLILSLAMVLSMVPGQVFAADTETVYTVTFDANGGEGTMQVQTVTAENTALSSNAFSRTCHTFAGWNTESDGSGTGYTDGAEVTLTENITLYAQWKLEHTGSRKVVYDQKPGCETEGIGHTVCTACGATLESGLGFDPTGHTWQAASCAAPETCSACGATRGEALAHTEVIDAAVAATCTATGLTEGKHCSACKAVLVAQTVVSAKGHTEVTDAAVAATCTATGLTEGKHCSVCKAVLVAQTTVPVQGHVDANTDHKCDRGCGKSDMGTHDDSAADKDHVCDYGCKAVLENCSDKTGDSNHACDICGKAGITAHTYADATCTVAQTCTECGETTGNALGHVDANTDHKCDRGCGKSDMGTHADADKDHKCDYGCAAEIGTHADTNKDHACDYGCKTYMGTHADSAADKDHVCDYGCKAVLENCSDKTGDSNHACDICGKAGITAHTYADATCTVAQTCTECGETTGNALGHVDANTDHKCDRGCGKSDMGTHADADKDHKCDYGCAAEIGTHADTNKDHACDYGCKTYMGTHADSAADKDHVCDYGCKAVLENCSDAAKDGNHACDICGKTATVCATSLVKTGAVAETCTEAGNREYYTCSDCGKYYSDSNAKAEIAKDSWIIAAKGHDWGAPSSYAINSNGTHTARYTCRHDASHTRQDDPVAHTYDKTSHACVCGDVDRFTITFDTVGGSEIPAITQPYNTKVAKPADPVKEGHTFAGWGGDIPATMPGENITIIAKWTVNSYEAIFDAGDGVWENGETRKVVETKYGEMPVRPADPQKLGYIFNGWTPELTPIGVSGAVYTAGYAAGTVSYTVETYTMDVSGSYGKPVIETKTGTTDTEVTEAPAEKTGFTLDKENSVLTGTVAADGTLVLKIYYIRNQYTLETIVEGKTISVKYYFEQEIVLENPTKYNAGGCPFPFTGWDKEVPDAMPAENLHFTASFADAVDHKSEAFTYTDDGCGWHDVTHACCGELTGREKHAYESGSCQCGKAQPNAWGYLEEGLYWEYRAGVLAIAAVGEAAMGDFASAEETPWQELRGKIEAVSVANGVTAIGANAFADCEKLNTVNLPDSVTAIGAAAFQNCKSLFGISLPRGLTEIADGTFQGCALNNIHLPDSLTTIGEAAFANNKNLTKLTIPANVADIEKDAFKGCTWLDTLTIHTKNLTVWENAFSGCSNLKKIYFSGSEDEWALIKNEKISTGNNSLKNASVVYAGEGDMEYNPVQEVHILDISGVSGKENAILDGKVILVDLNKVPSIVLHYQVLPEDASYPEISWTTNELELTDSSVDETGKLTLTNMKPGDMTLFAQNFVSGSKDPYTYTTASVRLQFRKMSIVGPYSDGNGNIVVAKDRYVKLNAVIEPDGADHGKITWKLTENTAEAEIDPETGTLIARASGSVNITATTADGLVAKGTVAVVEEGVAIKGEDTVLEGKSITLTAELPDYMANSPIKWRLSKETDTAYVTLTSKGKLTAKKTIEESVRIEVEVYVDGEQTALASKTVTVIPLTDSVAIKQVKQEDAETVTGQTLTVDLSSEKPLIFAAVTAPADAGKQVTWKVSDTKGTYADYTTDENGTITLTHKDKTGTVTLTATAADGSGKKATVKVQFVRAAQSIQILNAPQTLRAGSKITLTTNLATDKDLTDRTVVWSLNPEDLPYASITAKGVLTTYAFPNPVTITVHAAVKANQDIKTEARILLQPGAQAAQIKLGDKVLNKGEIVYAAVGEEVTLTGGTLPLEAGQGGTWKVSGKNADWTPSEDNKTLTIRMNQTGTATVTFTAADGSKKNTSVKVQAVQRGETMTLTAKGNATELRSGKTLQLTAAVDGATVKQFSWTVDKPEVATVTNGKVKALTVSENTPITVTATAIDGSKLEASYELLIKPAKDETLHVFLGGEIVTGTTRYLSKDAMAQSLTAKLYNAVEGVWADVTEAAVSISGKAVTRDENGIAPAAVGSSTVTVKYGKLSAKVTIKVVNPVEKIEITAKDGADYLLSGKTLKFTAAVTGADGAKPTVAKLSWSVDKPEAATISSSGSLKADKNVTKKTVVKVTAAATDGSGVFAEYTVTIYPQLTAILVKDEVSGQTLNQCVREFRVGDTLKLSAQILPEDAMQNVTWSISSTKLAELDNGTLTLKSKGNLTIKATAQDGSKRSISVKIKIV